MIPKTTPEAIIKALERFDLELRESADWSGWEQNENHKFAIQYNGRRYPVKKIISLAANIPVGSFSGGDEANRYHGAQKAAWPWTKAPTASAGRCWTGLLPSSCRTSI